MDLSLYDDEGRLNHETENMDTFKFICNFCWKESQLDFYRFSDPDLICYLKSLNEQYEKTKKALNKLYILFNNNIRTMKMNFVKSYQ